MKIPAAEIIKFIIHKLLPERDTNPHLQGAIPQCSRSRTSGCTRAHWLFSFRSDRAAALGARTPGEGQLASPSVYTYLSVKGYSEKGAKKPLPCVHYFQYLSVCSMKRSVQLSKFLEIKS